MPNRYQSIPHLPGSRHTSSDKLAPPEQVAAATKQAPDPNYQAFVLQKLDGSCMIIERSKEGGRIVPRTRAGNLAGQSPYLQHRLFDAWVMTQVDRFLPLLQRGECLVGEWLVQAHGSRYTLNHEPFVLLDKLSVNGKSCSYAALLKVAQAGDFTTPRLLHCSFKPPNLLRTAFSVEDMLKRLDDGLSFHGEDQTEGAVWRIERFGIPLYMVKFVKPEFDPGQYLGGTPLWNEGLETYLPPKALDLLGSREAS